MSVPTKYGMFQEHQYLKGGGPPPVPATNRSDGGDEPPADRDHGLNFKATVPRTGKGNDATFDKFQSLHLGDRYVDPQRKRLQAERDKKKGSVTETPFRAASPMKQSACVGDFYGTIQGKVPYEGSHVEIKKKKGDVPEVPKGIYTNPPKKGSFGFNKFTLSERVGFKGVATEYEYHADPDALQKQRQREAAEAERKARVSDLPFRPANPPKRGGPGVPNTTISKGKGIAGEWEYVVGAGNPGQASTRGEAKDAVPFKPSNTNPAIRYKPIEYIHDPEVPKMRAERERKMAESARLTAAGPFKPSTGPKTDMVRSIIRMNI